MAFFPDNLKARGGASLYFLLFVLLSSCTEVLQERKEVPQMEQATRPNILFILADDMGFSDLGCYGSEIHTPVLDSLAYMGLRMTQFYNTSRCCPSRASLMTGHYAHSVGIGQMTNGFPELPKAYSGNLSQEIPTIAELLKSVGYSTLMTGKWHLSEHESHYPTPLDRGFEHFFGLLQGASNYWNDTGYRSLDEEIIFLKDKERFRPEKGFYFTSAISNSTIELLEQQTEKEAGKPWFMYMAFTAPHWPLHAPEHQIQKYKNHYLDGWDDVRKERYANMLTKGIIRKSVSLADLNADVENWDTLDNSEKEFLVREMRTYAAMITHMDSCIGSVLDYLKRKNQVENTIIVFMSDNGGCHEEVNQFNFRFKYPQLAGPESSFESYGKPWASVSNTPFRWYKSYIHEGGISSPLIISGGGNWIKKKGIDDSSYAHIIDWAPTLLDFAKGNQQTKLKHKDKEVVFAGRSLHSYLTTEDELDKERALFWEHNGSAGVRKGDWKLVSKMRTKEDSSYFWELYNLKKDRSETKELSASNPQKVNELKILFKNWADSVGVMPFKEVERLKTLAKEKRVSKSLAN